MKTKTETLLLFTHSYPFGHGELFLDTEINYLKKYFQEIIIVPNEIGTLHREPPPSIIVETEFAELYRKKSIGKIAKRLITAGWSKDTYREILNDPSLLAQPSKLRILFYFVSQQKFYYQWLKNYLARNPRLKNGLFYSYWLHVQSHGIALFKQRDLPSLRHISRAHSYEIYLEDYPPSYLPFRQKQLPFVDHIYTVSDHGRQRLLKDFPNHIRDISTFRLGVEDPGFLNPCPVDDTISIVSTSFLVSEKRVNLLIEALEILNEMTPNQNVTWNHFGDGPMREELQALAQNLLGNKVEWTFHGHVSKQTLYDFYKNNPISLMVNTSRTEGIPVSIMEAQSCGIPVIATDVGAVSEIVNDNVGKLLSDNPKPHTIAEFIQKVYKCNELRQGARNNWMVKFNADLNFEDFAKTISYI